MHSIVKIHQVDSAIVDSDKYYYKRLEWENDAITYINNNDNCYMGVIGEFIANHLIKEYHLDYRKAIKIYNGEILDNKTRTFSDISKELFKQLKDFDSIILSFGRAEAYKNLTAAFKLGKELNIHSVVIGQLYYDNQPIGEDYKKEAEEYNGSLFLNPPLDFAHYILQNYDKNMICLVPSKKEIQGLIINEVRSLNKDNILIVANKINGLKAQIIDGFDGVLVDLDDIKSSALKIKKYFNTKMMSILNNNSQQTIKTKFDLVNNIRTFLNTIINMED